MCRGGPGGVGGTWPASASAARPRLRHLRQSPARHLRVHDAFSTPTASSAQTIGQPKASRREDCREHGGERERKFAEPAEPNTLVTSADERRQGRRPYRAGEARAAERIATSLNDEKKARYNHCPSCRCRDHSECPIARNSSAFSDSPPPGYGESDREQQPRVRPPYTATYSSSTVPAARWRGLARNA